MYVSAHQGWVTVEAPAKLNLFLEVLGKRPDGFHELETLMTSVSIFDTLRLRRSSDASISLRCHWASGYLARETAATNAQAASSATTASDLPSSPFGDLPPPEKNIVTKALLKLRELAGNEQLGCEVHLTKRIASVAGLGGASSDAVAAILAANIAWNLHFSSAELAEVAAAVGSDTVFFLAGGRAICRGRGERVTPVKRACQQFVVARPPVGLSTPRVFSKLKIPQNPLDIATYLGEKTSGEKTSRDGRLHNRLEQPARELTPWIGELSSALDRAGVAQHQMTGSGSSYFGLARSARHARRIAAVLRARQMGLVYSATSATASGFSPLTTTETAQQ